MPGAASADVVDGVFDVTGVVPENGEDVRIPGFGNFVTRKCAAVTGRHRRTDKIMSIAASTMPVFKQDQAPTNVVRCAGSSRNRSQCAFRTYSTQESRGWASRPRSHRTVDPGDETKPAETSLKGIRQHIPEQTSHGVIPARIDSPAIVTTGAQNV